MDRKVFRLRDLPDHVDRQDAAGILSRALGVDSSAIQIISLAGSVDPWVSSKIATLVFNDIIQAQSILEGDVQPNIKKQGDRGDEWVIELNPRDRLVMDTHFRGFTPLYDPASRLKAHTADCIAISGLASHPFGSWQPKGLSKDFMWIRDKLPLSLPNVRPILYGYNTTLIKSHSFQSIFDLALAFYHHLRANGWMSPTCKPLAFLAHSLGGIVLKRVFLLIAHRIERDGPIRQAIKGAVFFGVPNFGMKQSPLAAVVEGQPNAELVAKLEVNSKYLRQLDDQFRGISYLQNCSLYWAYETEESPTLAQDTEGVWSRTGPREILVTPESATRGLYEETRQSDSIFPINEDHSNMVKFSHNDPVYHIVVEKLTEILSSKDATPASINGLTTSHLDINATQTAAHPQPTQGEESSVEVILKSLSAPERDHRLEEIEEKFRNTFDWIYDRPEPGFSQWLQRGTGLFWINGKPGSGKSTLMKFLFQDRRTSDLLQGWRIGDTFTRVAFFFHYRGTSMQKSFVGLLRSVLSQIISQRPELCKFLQPNLKQTKSLVPDDWTLPTLQRGLYNILTQDEVPLHLCLFLDAIDEYDGRLESICQFLEDLGNIRPTRNKIIKICFSSRPWEIFLKKFGNRFGFRIHDYTQQDIKGYCLGSLLEENIPSAALETLVPYIVRHSQGVFLWVKLVVKDLSKASGVATMGNTELEKLLKSYPMELDSYYNEIIERIPHMHRWTAYAMLEIAVRSKNQLSPEQLVSAVTCSDIKTHQEADRALQRLGDRDNREWATFVSMQSKLYCGGLIEVLSGGIDDYYVQVLHQTVEDFVMDSKFKKLVLGDQAEITVENGNAFLSKLYLTRYYYDIPELADGMYARNAEKTTGRSLQVFLDSIPSHIFQRGESQCVIMFDTKTPLAFAASTGLRLYIIEKLAGDPDLLRNSRETLLSYVVRPNYRRAPEDLVQTAKLLLDRGFTLDQDPAAFGLLMGKMARVRNGQPGRTPSQVSVLPVNEYSDTTIHTIYIQLAELLLNRGQNPNVDVFFERLKFHCKPLHICPPPLMMSLLDKGASINALSSVKKTPLDHCFEDTITDWENYGGDDSSWHREVSLLEAYQMTCLLASRGGVTKQAKSKVIKSRLSDFESRGWPTEELRARLLPPLTLRGTIKSTFKRMSSPSGRV